MSQQTVDINDFYEIIKYKQIHNACYFITNKMINDNVNNFIIYENATLLFSTIDINNSDKDFTFYVIYRAVKDNDEEGLITFNINTILKLITDGSLTALYTSNNKPDNEINNIINRKD